MRWCTRSTEAGLLQLGLGTLAGVILWFAVLALTRHPLAGRDHRDLVRALRSAAILRPRPAYPLRADVASREFHESVIRRFAVAKPPRARRTLCRRENNDADPHRDHGFCHCWAPRRLPPCRPWRLATIAGATLQQSAQRTAATDVVDIPADRHDRPTVPVMINNQGPATAS